MEASAPSGASLTRTDINLIIAGLMMAMLLAALDQTIVATAMPTIGRELGDVEHLPWIVSGYLLAATAATPLYGKLADIHGRRIMLMISISIFLVGSVFCALAPSMILLGIARAVQGIGGGGLIALSQTIIADVLPPRERARYQVYVASVFVLASLAGPLLGGFLAEHLHWSVIFWINIPLGFVAVFMIMQQLKRLPRHERPHRLDVPGAVLLILATTSLLVTLSWGGVRYAWTSSTILLLAGISAVFWLVFVVRLRHAAEPLIPLSVLSNKVMICAVVAASCSMGLFIGLTIYMPIYFEAISGLSASESGVALLPLMLGTVLGATISGRVMAHIEHYKLVPICGLSVALACTLVLAVMPGGLPLSVTSGLLAFISFGLGTVLSVSTISIQNAIPLHQLGTALASANLFRQLAAALLVAVFGTIVIGAGAEGAVRHGLDAMHPQFQDTRALITAYRAVFIATAIGIAIDLLAMVFLEEQRLESTFREDPERAVETPIGE